MSLSLDQLIDVILLESGQFIADLDATLLDKTKLGTMVKRELAWYSRYQPFKATVVSSLYDKKVFSLQADGFVPKNIVDIRTDRFNFIGYTTAPIPGPVHSYYWRYENPILYFRYPEGPYQMSYISDHVYDDVNQNLPTIDIGDRIVNMMVGRFMMTVGRSRKAFTVDEIPLTTDAEAMYSEGKELYDKTEEEIKQNSRFNLAILV
ncbi:hypothetical protein [Ralstonia phage RP13]|nr:hypothetical protein [Ralstonia phage RP13]